MRRKLLIALTAVVVLTAGGAIVAIADSPDPCDSHTSDRAYLDCRLDRIERLIKGEPDPSPSPSVTPTPTPTVPPTGDFPGPDNTGVPDGTELTAYTGPKTITRATVIDGKTITGTLVVKASLTIRNSTLAGTIDGDYGKPVTIEDSEINGGKSSAPAVGYGDITMRRTEVKGSRVSVLCGSDCLIEDSWLHGQYLKPGTDWHVNGYVSNGGSNVVVRHNTIACDPRDNSSDGGCTGPAASFGDFNRLDNILYENNLIKAGPGGYCLHAGHNPSKPYGDNPTNIRVIGNVFERGPGGKCGYWGPATSFKSGGGNVWTGNVFDDGTPVNP